MADRMKFRVETAATENGFARVRGEDGAQYTTELLTSEPPHTRVALQPHDVIEGVVAGRRIVDTRVVIASPPPADRVAAHRAVLEQLAAAGFDVPCDDETSVQLATQELRGGGHPLGVRALLLGQWPSIWVSSEPDEHLAEVPEALRTTMAQRGCPIRVELVDEDDQAHDGFWIDGGPTLIPFGPGHVEAPEHYYGPLFAYANEVLARAGSDERWRRERGSWILVDPERAAVLERLGLCKFDPA